MKVKAIFSTTTLGVLLLIGIISCDANASHKTIGNTQDSSSVNKAGGLPIRDTTTINKNRRDSAANPVKAGNAKGNVDPSGRIKNQ